MKCNLLCFQIFGGLEIFFTKHALITKFQNEVEQIEQRTGSSWCLKEQDASVNELYILKAALIIIVAF